MTARVVRSDHHLAVDNYLPFWTMNQPQIIAIDGPAASGKTTVGQLLADHFDYIAFDTGVMYRAVTVGVLIAGIDPADEEAVNRYAVAVDIAIAAPDKESENRNAAVLVNGIDLTWQLQGPLADRYVSQVAAWPDVRVEMVRRQREIGERGGVVMIGRDIGTVVMPDAPLKLFMVASAEERAQRRYAENKKRSDTTSFDEILSEIVRRDKLDSSRKHSPMVAADDAKLIDTTGKSPDQILREILGFL